jgi:hypothetical protein
VSIVNLIKETCEDLINLHLKNPTHTKILFPRYRKGEARISEQEARFCFAAAVERRAEYRYSVETPTLETYSFTDGGGKISAQTDLTLWDLDGKKKEFDIEFKAHNPEPKSIEKDIEKLVREKTDGVWFHLFKNIDQGTFPALAGKFEEALLKHGQTREKDLLFAVCVLEKGICLLGTLPVTATSQTLLDAFFNDGSALIKDPALRTLGDWVILIP